MRAKLLLVLPFLLAGIIGCATTPTPAPTTLPTTIPTNIPPPTVAPTNTSLPPTPTPTNTRTPAPPTNTPIPTTPAPTATNTRPPVTVTPTVEVTATPTEVVMRFGAPILLDPKDGDIRTARRDAFEFRWEPVGDFAANECYLLRLRLINLADPNQNYGEQTYLIESTCNWSTGNGNVEFVVNGRPPAPNYDGLIAEADGKAGGLSAQEYLVQWDVVAVVNQDGTITPISPPSATGEFRLLNP